MKLEFVVNGLKLNDLFNIFASDEDISKHLESVNISYYYETIKVRSYNVSVSTTDPALVNKISSVLEEERCDRQGK